MPHDYNSINIFFRLVIANLSCISSFSQNSLLCFWGPPVGKIPSSVVILLQRKYLNAQENNQHINSSIKGARYDLTPERAGTLAKEILASVNVNRKKVICCSLFIVCYLLFVICYFLFAICYLLFI